MERAMVEISSPVLTIRLTEKKDEKKLSDWLQDDEALTWFPMANIKQDIKKAVDFWIDHTKSGSCPFS